MPRTLRSVAVAIAVAALAGLGAGAAVGLADGIHAGVVSRVGLSAALVTALLVATIDALVAAPVAAAVAGLRALRSWGHARRAGGVARFVSWVVSGLLCAFPAVLALLVTAARMNRFLAAAIVAGGALIGGCVALALQPALARVASLGRSKAPDPVSEVEAPVSAWPVSTLGALGVTVAILVAFLTVVFLVAWRTAAPLPRSELVARSLTVGGLAIVLPWLMSFVHSRALSRTRTAGARAADAPAAGAPLLMSVVGLGALLVVMIGVVWIGVTRWESDLRFVPWRDVVAVFAIAALTWGIHHAWAARPRRIAGGLLVIGALLGLAASAGGLLVAGGSEAARKAATARAGLAASVLTVVRRTLDFDRDGYPRLFGGGDCNDRDRGINPAALDWPDDGIDQDCDGRDARIPDLRPGPFHAVPDSVPHDANVLLIAVDTLRADHLGCYGYKRDTSPAIDQLSRESVLFENGWAHAPSTRYSMPALVTGRWPSAIEWNNRIWWPGLGPSMRTIYEAMKDLKYFVAAFWAFDYFDPSAGRGFDRGVDLYDARRAALHKNVGGPAESLGSSAREMADDGISFITSHANEKWFLTVHFYDPHLAHQNHPEVPTFGDGPVDRYDNEIRFTDMHVGRLLDKLRGLGLWDRTIVILTGDHGEGLGERGILAHGYHLYPPQTKVPFVVRVPGIAARRVATPVGHVDLAPTLFNLAGGTQHPPATGAKSSGFASGFLGSSFVDLLLGERRQQEQEKDENTEPAVFQEVSYEGDNQKRALVTQTHQLIWNWTPQNTTECYDLSHGDLEPPDLWGRAAGEPVCTRLKRRLQEMVAALSLPTDYLERIGGAVTSPSGKAPRPANVLQVSGEPVRLGDAVEVVGFDLPARKLSRGQDVEIGVHFRSLKRVPPGWRLFMHLNGPGTFDNLDHVPVGGAYPVERWAPGQTIVDRYRFSIPAHRPVGQYQVSLGFWRGSERMPVNPATTSDGQQRLRLVDLDVE